MSEVLAYLKGTNSHKIIDSQAINITHIQDFMFLKLIIEISPILNSDCKLDCLNKEIKSYEGQSFANVMGLCFNNEMYFQMSKGLIHPDILEMISNLNVVAGGIMVAPTMYIKQIWDQDPDFKFYYNQIISGLHDSLVSENLETKN